MEAKADVEDNNTETFHEGNYTPGTQTTEFN